MKNKAVFLDRDGVINEIVYHKEMGIVDSPFTVEQFKLLPEVGNAINKFHDQGFKVILVSNQPGLAKDHYDINIFEKIKGKLESELAKVGAKLDAEYYCFHHPDAKIEKYKKICDCRKPKPGMIMQAAEDHNIDISKSWMIGDGINDIQAGQAVGCKTILIGRMKCDLCKILEDEKVKPDFIAANLYKAFLIIEKNERT
ncbi:MAG: HAD family hydrolase [Thermoplasmatales archaeon]|nr:MAG: HAD family hydrolase [Thermoplasmatales archaeon]